MSKLSIKDKPVRKPTRPNQKPKVYPRPKNMRPKKPESFLDKVKKKWKIYMSLPGAGLGIMPRPGEYSRAQKILRDGQKIKEMKKQLKGLEREEIRLRGKK